MTGKAIYIHAGPGKTGSTAIQDALHAGRARLAGRGLHYWSTAPNHSWPMALALDIAGPDEGGFRPYLKPHFALTYGEPAALRDSLAHESRAGPGKFLISGEKISQFPKERLAALRRLVDPGNAELAVIFYVREPRGWLSSLVQQRLKEGVPIAETVAKFRRLPYRSWIGTLGDAFGEGNVRLRLYRQDRQAPNALMADFFAAIDESPALAEQFPAEWTNTAMPTAAAHILDAVNRAARAKDFDRQYGWLLESFLLPHLHGASFRLDAGLLDAVVAENADQLAWLSQRLGVDVLALSRPEERVSPDHQAPMPEPTAQLMFALAAEILRCRSHCLYQQGLIKLARQDDAGAMRAFAQALASDPEMTRTAVALDRLGRGRRDVPGALPGISRAVPSDH